MFDQVKEKYLFFLFVLKVLA